MAVVPTPAGRHFGSRPPIRRRGLHRRSAPVAALAGILGLGLLGGAAFTATPTSGTPTSGSVRAASAAASTRLAGADRYATAAAVSEATFGSRPPVAYLATGTDYPDALTAAAAAGGRGPVLLTATSSLPPATANELSRLQPAHVVVVGGPSAVGAPVLAALSAVIPSIPVTRSTGVDRYDTAAQLSRATFPNGAPIAYVASGADYPDALAAAAATGGRGPVLLTRTTSVPETTIAELRRLGVSRIAVVGGSAAVSDATFLSIAAAVPSAPMSRLAGGDRFATAAEVAAKTFDATNPATVVYIATGRSYPDALAAAAAAGGRGPVLLVNPESAPPATMTELRDLRVDQMVLVGGAQAISSATETQVRSTLSSTAVAGSTRATLAVAAARAQLGKPYLWAGAGPDAFDCSGLTMYAWAAAGVNLPHNAAAQAAMIRSVPLADVAPGDLIFYGDPDIYHVGIYIGGGQMIEAAHSGTLVRIADIHRPDLLSAGRPG